MYVRGNTRDDTINNRYNFNNILLSHICILRIDWEHKTLAMMAKNRQKRLNFFLSALSVTESYKKFDALMGLLLLKLLLRERRKVKDKKIQLTVEADNFMIMTQSNS